MILQVLALTPDKIAALPAAERDAIQQLVSHFIVMGRLLLFLKYALIAQPISRCFDRFATIAMAIPYHLL